MFLNSEGPFFLLLSFNQGRKANTRAKELHQRVSSASRRETLNQTQTLNLIPPSPTAGRKQHSNVGALIIRRGFGGTL